MNPLNSELGTLRSRYIRNTEKRMSDSVNDHIWEGAALDTSHVARHIFEEIMWPSIPEAK